jgi:hypothetical protein
LALVGGPSSGGNLSLSQSFTPKFIEEGDVYVNVTWVSDTEFRNLKA